jgi:hypothetical protein
MTLETLETCARKEVQTGGQHYVEFHRRFKKKGVCEKLYLILASLPCYLFYNYIAEPSEKYLYNGLLNFLKGTINGTTN